MTNVAGKPLSARSLVDSTFEKGNPMGHTHAHSAHDRHGSNESGAAEPGALIHWPRRYDLMAAVMFAGRGRRFRGYVADLLGVDRGDRVLDVGCGTGTLTLVLAGRAGPQGAVTGVDAAPEMIAAAQAKAGGKKGAPTFQVAPAQDLPFPDGSFDAVSTSLMIHHLPEADRTGAIREVLRVLRPGGRLLIVEFQAPQGRTGKRVTRHLFGHAMADNTIDEVAVVTAEAGAAGVECHPSGVGWLGLVTASKQAAGS